MRYFAPLNGCFETFAHATRHLRVALGRFFIDIDLPSNATIVSASVGDTSKAFIIIGSKGLQSADSTPLVFFLYTIRKATNCAINVMVQVIR